MPETTFATLEQFLLQLGFRLTTVPGSHVIFEHPRANLRIVLRPYRLEEAVDPAGLVYVRRNLDEWGILPREAFDDRIRRQALAG